MVHLNTPPFFAHFVRTFYTISLRFELFFCTFNTVLVKNSTFFCIILHFFLLNPHLPGDLVSLQFSFVTVTWLKYCRNGVKLFAVNQSQSINQSIKLEREREKPNYRITCTGLKVKSFPLHTFMYWY